MKRSLLYDRYGKSRITKAIELLICLVFWSIPLTCANYLDTKLYAGGMVVGSGVNGATCTSIYGPPSNSSSRNVHQNDDHYYSGMLENSASHPAYNICKVIITMAKSNGSIAGLTYVARVWNVNGSTWALTTQIQESTGVTGNNSWTGDSVTFTFPTPAAITANANYAITVDAGAYSGTNYAAIFQKTGGSEIVGSYTEWNAAKSLVYNSDTADLVYEVFSQ